MAGRRCLLNPEILESLVKSIKSGAFDWVAAEGAGIGRRTFYDWMARSHGVERRFIEFGEAIRRARAEARIKAESLVLEKDPLSWLRLGPGQEREDEPGWTNGKSREAKPAEGEGENSMREVLEIVADDSQTPAGNQACPRCGREG